MKNSMKDFRPPLILVIRGNLPSANQLLRMHWAKRQRLINTTWAWVVKQALQKAGFKYIGNTSYFKEPVTISVTCHLQNKRWIKDTSNLVAPIDKLIVDNLVRQRVLVDDSPEYLIWGKVNQIVEPPARIVVNLTEAFPAAT